MRRLLAFALLAWIALYDCGPPAHAQDKPARIAASAPPAVETPVAGLILAPKAFRAAAEKVRPSIVTIETLGGVDTPDAKAAGIAGLGPTTGLVVSAEGHIITSTFNFVRKPSVITVTLPEGERLVATLLGRDDTRKLCLLQVKPPRPLPLPNFAKPDEVRIGQWALSLGLGYDGKTAAFSAGVVSALGRLGGKALQTDANTSPVNYGGPLVDLDGNVLGICVPLSPASSSDGAGSEWYDSGIGFAVPLASGENWIAALKQGQHIRPAFMGISTGPTDDNRDGASVKKVEPKSPAAQAGIKEGDVILALDDAPIFDHVHLRAILQKFAAGEKTHIVWRRGDETIAADLEFAPRPETPAKEPNEMPPSDSPGK